MEVDPKTGVAELSPRGVLEYELSMFLSEDESLWKRYNFVKGADALEKFCKREVNRLLTEWARSLVVPYFMRHCDDIIHSLDKVMPRR